MQRMKFRGTSGAVCAAVMVMMGLAALAVPRQADAQTDIVLQAASAATKAGGWKVVRDATAISGSTLRHADRGGRKITTAKARPSDYFEMTFQAQAGTSYRLWLRGRADRNYWGNDSVFVQFDGSVSSRGTAAYRIGTKSALEVNLEPCAGCGISGWVWQDTGYGRGVLGPLVRFARSGTQRLRIQTREDGLAIDQIVLSPSRYLRTAPRASASAAKKPTAAPPSGGSTGGQAPTGGSAGGSTGAPRGAEDDDDDGGDDDDDDRPSGGTVLKVLDWNIHHGVGTDGKYDIDRIATAIAKTGANVVSLNEVERYTGWGNEDQPERFAALLRAKTGRTWRYNFAQNSGRARGQGNLILTTFEIESEDDGLLSHTRSVARIAILVNGVRVNVFSTHLDAESGARRARQMRELVTWADNFPEQRILVGDFNAWPGAGEIGIMTAAHADAWATAKRSGKAVAYSGNSAGNTRNSRIDYAFYSKGAGKLRLREARVWDMRDRNGRMPSDHRPLSATFDVR